MTSLSRDETTRLRARGTLRSRLPYDTDQAASLLEQLAETLIHHASLSDAFGEEPLRPFAESCLEDVARRLRAYSDALEAAAERERDRKVTSYQAALEAGDEEATERLWYEAFGDRELRDRLATFHPYEEGEG